MTNLAELISIWIQSMLHIKQLMVFPWIMFFFFFWSR
jgi:hypothetical protein